MVDIKRNDITLSDWTKGISADEFAGGSYFYSEGISSGYDTKGFELGNYISKHILNYRDNGYPVALAPTKEFGMLAFTKDGSIETEELYNGSLKGNGDEDGGGALFSVYGWASYNDYSNGVSYGDKIIGIRARYIDILSYNELFTPTAELLSNPRFGNSGENWTIGAGWTITENGAEHTSGTGTLSSNINFSTTPTGTDYVRVAIKIKNSTGGHINVGLNNPSTDYQVESGLNGWITLVFKCSSSSSSLTITPTNTFNGTIEAVNVHLYNSSALNIAKSSLYNGDESQPHPALVWEGDLYIACGEYVNIFSLTDWGRTEKQLVDKNFTIISMTQQAGNIIIWATNGFDSRQYYWNGVDAVASEVIEWKGLIIKGVTGTETLSYVLTASGNTQGAVDGYEYRLYIVSGYQRSLIASKLYQYMSSEYINKEPYNLNKKFDFNDVEDDHSMLVYLDSLFIPGCDGIYKYGYDIPGMQSNRTRPIKYDTGAKHITLGQRNDFLDVGFSVNGVNYIGEVNDRLYASKGYVVTSSIYRDKLGTKKALEKLKIGYKNVDESVGGINVYAIVDDTYFWRFYPTTTPENRPHVGDIYEVANATKAKVINVDEDKGVITLITVENKGSYIGTANTVLNKISGHGDEEITVGYNFDNMCLVKSIKSNGQKYDSDLIFGKDFIDSYLPYWHKLQLVIELESNDYYLSPEVYEISMVSDITDTTL